MIVETREYIICDSEHGLGPVFVPKVPWSKEFPKIMEEEKVTGFRLPDTLSWDYDDLEFLHDIKHLNLRQLSIWHILLKDVSLMEMFPDLELIGLASPFTKGPDFSVFKNLRIALVTWRAKMSGLWNCKTLDYLNMEKYPYEDLQPIAHLQKLKKLYLTSGKLTSLSAIEELENLELIDLYNCPKLQSISGIEQCPKLSLVEIERCKLITDVSEYGALVKHVQN